MPNSGQYHPNNNNNNNNMNAIRNDPNVYYTQQNDFDSLPVNVANNLFREEPDRSSNISSLWDRGKKLSMRSNGDVTHSISQDMTGNSRCNNNSNRNINSVQGTNPSWRPPQRTALSHPSSTLSWVETVGSLMMLYRQTRYPVCSDLPSSPSAVLLSVVKKMRSSTK